MPVLAHQDSGRMAFPSISAPPPAAVPHQAAQSTMPAALPGKSAPDTEALLLAMVSYRKNTAMANAQLSCWLARLRGPLLS